MSNQQTELHDIARHIRELSLKMTTRAGTGHPGGSLSSADLLASLFFNSDFNYDPERPDWVERDYFVLSAGHLAPALYSTLAMADYFPESELDSLRQFGSRLQGHPHLGSLPGIETSTGSLGQGFSVAVGMALGFSLNHRLNHVYCLMGDGEQEEGQVWEAAAAAAKYGLVNLICMIDLNGMQENGRTEAIMPEGNIAERYRQLGWQVQEIDGHDLRQIAEALTAARAGTHAPQLIVAHTVMGKGVPFMEEDGYKWHGKALTEGQLAEALSALKV